MNMKHLFFAIFCSLPFHAYCSPIEVRIAAVAALSVTDSDYSERFKMAYQAGFFYAAGELQNKLEKCGYRIGVDFDYCNCRRRRSLI